VPFEYVLADLVAKNDGVLGALCLDEDGETVELACREGTPYQVRIAGAYVPIYLRKLGGVLEAMNRGSVKTLHIEREDLHLHVAVLPEGYSLVLLQRAPAEVWKARRTLEAARRDLARELFGQE
jgi:predicted regulator of Ras-like GTPase activity (Roadblock/LC7/MglB family)